MKDTTPKGVVFQLFAALLFVFVLTGVLPSAAEPLRRPDQIELPVQILVTMNILDVDEINSADQNFTANVYYELHWNDPSLAHDDDVPISYNIEDIWHPRVAIVNRQLIRTSFQDIAYVSSNGDVTHYQRVWGTFSQPFHLQDFPRDQQYFEIRLAAIGYQPGEIELLVNKEVSGLAKEFSQPDWKIESWDAKSEAYQPGDNGPETPSVLISYTASRKVGYYVLKILAPLFLIVMMSWVVFWIDPSDGGTQISVAITSMLTLIAYRFMVDAMLPVVSYLTRMDIFIFGSTVLVFAALIQVVYTSSLAKRRYEDKAIRWDFWCRFIFPVLFVALLVASFWL